MQTERMSPAPSREHTPGPAGAGVGHGTSSRGGVQLKGALAGKGFDEQVQMLTPRAPVQREMTPAQAPAGAAAAPSVATQPDANAAAGDAGADAQGDVAVALTVQNEFEDPSGKKTDRTTVGVGEISWISASVAGGTWSSSGGTGTLDQGDYKWTAPGTAGAVTITYTLNDKATTLTMNVVAPSGTVTGQKTGELDPGAGVVGAGMTLDLVMSPLTVSFTNLGWIEEQGAISGTGSMSAAQPTIRHNTNWSKMGTNGNNEIADQAMLTWSEKAPGTATYEIKQKYRAGASGTPTEYATLKQELEIFDAAGEAQVRKAGASSAKRKP